ncbi:MAG: hypothetical protein KAQ68_08130 [Clostridiales bacterium]|nr:hypothetical protein [Clostridiales bacterium]
MQSTIKTLMEMTLFSSALIMVVWGIKQLLHKKISAKLMAALWIVVLVRLILPITVESPVHFGLIGKPSADMAVRVETPRDEVVAEDVSVSPMVALPPVLEEETFNRPIFTTTKAPELSLGSKVLDVISGIDIWNALFIAWLVGALFIVTKSIYRIICFYKKLRNTHAIDEELDEQLAYAMKVAGTDRKVRIVSSPYVDIPIVYGIMNPVIVLPIDLKEVIGEKKLLGILLHELCHVKRYDILKNYLWLVAKTLNWFNPLVHVAYRSYLENVEVVCDEMVLKYLEPCDHSDYTQSLLDVMRLTQRNNALPLTVSFCKNNSAMKRRVINMMKPTKKSKAIMMITILLACVMIFACFTTACLKGEDEENQPTTSERITVTSEMIEQGRQAIKDLELTTNEKIRYRSSEQYFNDEILWYLADGKDSYKVLASDYSLVSYRTDEIDLSNPIQLSDDEMIEIAQEYVREVWDADVIEVLEHKVWSPPPFDEKKYLFVVEGTMGVDEQAFQVGLNGNGALEYILSFPSDVNREAGISVDEAKEIAVVQIIRNSHIKDESNLVIKSEDINEEYLPIYMIVYEYRSDNPTEDDFDFDYYVGILASNGDIVSAESRPIKDTPTADDNSSTTYINGVKVDSVIAAAKEKVKANRVMIDKGKRTINDMDIVTSDILDYMGAEQYFDDQLLKYTSSPMIWITLLESDQSLVRYRNKHIDEFVPFRLSDEELKDIALDYAEKTWQKSNVVIDEYESSSYEHSAEKTRNTFYAVGTIGEDKRPFRIQLNGEGELDTMESYPRDVNWEAGVSIDAAKETAIEFIKKIAHISDDTYLTLASANISDAIKPTYLLEFEYRSDNPTIEAYDYDCKAYIYAGNGVCSTLYVYPITDNLDVVQLDEAIQIAKQHVIKVTDIKDATKLTVTHSLPTLTSAYILQPQQQDFFEKGEILYHIQFAYESSYRYVVSVDIEGNVHHYETHAFN